jgi:hypothetical protein
VYTPLSEVSPVTSGDSGVLNMQHMGVAKDFKIYYAVTNFVTVPAPVLTSHSANVFSWLGVSNLTYSIQASTNLPVFQTVGSATSSGTNFSFTSNATSGKRFFRVVYP